MRKKYLRELLHQKEQVFHTQDLSVLWGISNKNTLYTTIKRYCQQGILFPVYKGMYSALPITELDPFILGIKALHRYGYVSCEAILAQHGLMNPLISEITLISSISRRFQIGNSHFRCRRIVDQFLYQPIGIKKESNVCMASKERAVADTLYFNPKFHFDAPIEWKKIREIQEVIGYPLTKERYVTTKSKRRHS